MYDDMVILIKNKMVLLNILSTLRKFLKERDLILNTNKCNDNSIYNSRKGKRGKKDGEIAGNESGVDSNLLYYKISSDILISFLIRMGIIQT